MYDDERILLAGVWLVQTANECRARRSHQTSTSGCICLSLLLLALFRLCAPGVCFGQDGRRGFVCCQLARPRLPRARQPAPAVARGLLAAVRHAQTSIYFAASPQGARQIALPGRRREDVNCSGGWQARPPLLGPVILLSVADDFCSSGSWPRGPDLFSRFCRQQNVSSRRSLQQITCNTRVDLRHGAAKLNYR